MGRERTAEVPATALQAYRYPLPSSFGPYALSRAAAETGGRYVLWSWNRTGRTTLLYDDVRCDLLAPDLRDRETIRADAIKRPLPGAIIKVGKSRVSMVVFTKTPYGNGVPGRTSPADSDARRGRTGPGSAPGQGGTTGR